MKVLEKINGWKTYGVAVAAIIYALYGHYVAHSVDFNTMMDTVLGAGGLAALRHGMQTGA